MSTPSQLKLMISFAQFICKLRCSVFFTFYEKLSNNVFVITHQPHRISCALMLLLTVVTSITFAADSEFRNSKYLKVIWMMIFQMMIAWFGATSTTNVAVDPSYLILFFVWFIAFIFMCLCPITINIWLWENFRHEQGCFVKMSKVSIPQQYTSFIENDEAYVKIFLMSD